MEKECVVRRARSRLPLYAGLLLLAVAFCALLLSRGFRPALAALAEARIRSIAVRALNDAILDSLDDEETYAALISVRETGEKAYMLQADTRGMNKLAADCALAAQERILAAGEQGLSLPLGTITGISLLAGRGPAIHVSFTPAGSVNSAFRSELLSSGINQTLYRVNLLLTARVKLIMPGVSKTITVETQAAIAESIIVGDVPQVYTDVANQEDMLNLIPTELP